MNDAEPGDSNRQINGDVYSAGERGWMTSYQQFKQVAFRPLLRLLASMGLQPNHITFVSLVCGLACCPAYFWQVHNGGWAHAAFGLLFLHFVIDGIDGPLARHLNKASSAGSFVDTAADQIVVAATTATLMMVHVENLLGGVDIWAGSCYLFFYTVTVVLAIVRNTMGIPYRFLFRPRNFVYLWWLLEYYWFPGTHWEGSIQWLVWICNIILMIAAGRGFLAVWRYLENGGTNRERQMAETDLIGK